MKFSITGRHVELTKAIKAYVQKRMRKLEDYFDFAENGELHIIVTVDKYRHIAEANLRSKHHDFSAKVETKDMYSSIDMLEDKLMNQVKKQKDKQVKFEKENKRSVKEEDESKGAADNEEILEEELQAVKPMDTEEAMDEVEMTKEKLLLFYNVDFNKICLLRKRKDGKYGMTISKY